MRRRSRQPRIARWIVRALLLTLAVLLAFEAWVFAAVVHYDQTDPQLSAVMRQDLERRRASRPYARLVHEWVAYERIAPSLLRALVAAEDARFVEHRGFDWEGIQLALSKNARAGDVVAGGSTITQQLAKNLFLSHDRSYLRKAQEAITAVMLEVIMSKRRILEIYANVVEWGDGLYGAQAAALYYYGVDASELSEAQAARLAAMLPRPRYYQDRRGSRYLRARTEAILGHMDHARIP